jgi:hypothetical protein
MTKDEALLKALEDIKNNAGNPEKVYQISSAAIKQARSAPVQEPVGGTQVSKVWWDGEKLMAKPIPLEDFYLPTPVQPVQEPVAQLGDGVLWCDTCRSVQETIHHTSPNDRDVWCKGEAAWLQGPFYTTPPAAPVQPVQEPVAWLKRHELADLLTCNHRRLGADSPHIWAPNAPDAPPPELDLVAVYTTPPAAPVQPVVTVAWVLLREDEDGFEPIQFYGGKEKPETAAGELKPRFTLRPVCFADTTPPATQPAPTVQPVAWRAWFDADNGARWLFTLWPEEERLDVKWEPLYTTPPEQTAPVLLTERELELIDGMIEVQLDHAKRCDSIANRTMAEKQKGWDMERVALLQKLKKENT